MISKSIKQSKLEMLSRLQGPILLTGETGTGKTHFAKKIHESSNRANNLFVSVNLATLSEELFESELFGHKRGSFTGAHSDRTGYVELSNDGTLFLDEVGEISLKCQKKLLTLLDERIYTPVGSTVQKKFNGTIILATNKNLKELVNSGQFREDLYYRLQLFSYHLSPLRNCRDEISVYFDSFIAVFSKKYLVNDKMIRFSTHCIDFLFNKYLWPGNIRELKNVVEYLVAISVENINEIEIENLPNWVLESIEQQDNIISSSVDSNKFSNVAQLSIVKEDQCNQNNCQKHDLGKYSKQEEFQMRYDQAFADFEKKFFTWALERNKGAINKSVGLIGLSKVTLIAKIRKYGINTYEMRLKEQAAREVALVASSL